jgi:charged multivesicular body protein 2A
MNKKMNIPELQKIMAEFMKENEKAELTQEVMGDAIDDAMEEEGTAADEEAIVNQVLDELGVGMSEAVPEAPTDQAKVAQDEKQQEQGGTTTIILCFLPPAS